jgi:hypothetical protein
MENFPQVVGKFSALMYKLIEGLGKEAVGMIGNEKFCMILNFFAFPSLGIMDRGDDWNGPIKSFRVSVGKGPMSRPFSSSFWIMLLNSTENSLTDSLFGGVCTTLIDGKSILKPKRKPEGTLAKRLRTPARCNSYSHTSAL